MNTTQLKLEILRFPIGVVLGAYATRSNVPLTGKPSDQKNIAAEWLAGCIQAGSISLADIAATAPVVVSSGPVVDTAAVDAVGAVASRAESAALKAIEAVKRSHQKLSDELADVRSVHLQDSEELGKAIRGLSTKIGETKIDDRKVQEAVTKVVADAFAPFRKAVEDANAQSVVADLSSVHKVNTLTCAVAFGVEVLDRKGNPLTVDIWNDPSAPAVDPNFIWTADILQHLILSQDTGENVWFGGPKGTGKSETARQFAAVTGRAFKRINFHKYTTAEEYIGAVGLENGQTVFKRGDFLAAFTHPSTVILLDEVTNADPGELAPLNGFLEPNSAVSFGGSVQTRAPGVLVFAADNTFGNGDDSGRYAGTRAMNSALVDRFSRVVQFDYLPLRSEVDAVVRHTGCDSKLAEHILSAVQVARAKVQTGEVIDPPSIRSVIAFVRALRILPLDRAWAATVAARQPAESLPGLSAIYASCICETTINNYL